MIREAIAELIWIEKQKVVWFPTFKENLREVVISALKNYLIYKSWKGKISIRLITLGQRGSKVFVLRHLMAFLLLSDSAMYNGRVESTPQFCCPIREDPCKIYLGFS